MGRINVYMQKSNKTQLLYLGVTGVQSLAVDWLTDQLYWINPTDLAICAGASDGTGFVMILETMMNPTGLVLHPPTSNMFWMNRDESGQMFLESAAMDGSLRRTLAIVTAEETKALTVDSVTGRLFWISKYKESIETVFLDGSGRFSILGAFPRGTEVLGFASFQEWFYWSDGKQLWQTSRNSPQQSTALIQSSSSLLAIFHPLQRTNASASPCAHAACSHVCLPSPHRVPGYICACPDGMILRSSGKCENLIVLYATVNHLHKLEFDVTGVKKIKVLDLPEAITSFDFDWKRNWIYWINATGQLKRLKPQLNQSELIHTPVPVCFLRVDQEEGSVYWLSCSGHLIGMNKVNSHLPKTLYDTTRVITELHLDWMRGSLFWIEDRRILRMNLTDWRVWELLDASEAELGHLVLDIKSNRLIWNDQNAGMISLSIPRNEVTFLNGSWSSVESLVAAYDPYLLSLQGRGLVLWNSRRTRSVSAIEVEQLNAKAVMMMDSEQTDGQTLSSVAKVCPRTFMSCLDGSKCIPYDHFCDGDKDCKDGSDEKNCREGCNQPENFQCLDGKKCIDPAMVCDGNAQCSDGSDEANCNKGIQACDFTCDNEKCFPLNVRCDGVQNCLDLTDETDCENSIPILPARACPRTSVSCLDGDDCIFLTHLCDGDLDCKDGSDEENCRMDCRKPGYFPCGNGSKCLRSGQVCDGTPQCEDQSDEANCRRPTECAFLCHNGRCLPSHMQCDGKEDCADGSDEENCIPSDKSDLFQKVQTPTCLNESVLCPGEGICIARQKLCDGVEDCSDASDEKNCLQQCNAGYFRCPEGKCIKTQLVCDGIPQCFGGSDEQDCPGKQCAFSCDKNTKCLPETVRCDGRKDCKDGSDEVNCNQKVEGRPNGVPARICPRTFVTCSDGSDCIPNSHRCDGDKDCKDGSDEANCPQGCNNPESFRCQDGQKCIELGMVCDGEAQCFDRSDEVNCQKAVESCGLMCDNSKCLPLHMKCDGVLNCLDQSDESNCQMENRPPVSPARNCPRTFVSCRDGRDCISHSHLCDGDLDCDDESDEEYCRADCSRPGHFQCLDKKKCLKLKQVCDGVPQCDDQSDEAKCKKPVEDCGFFCGNGRCLPAHVQCDGKQDCADGADESNCVPKVISMATSSPPPLTCPSPSSPCLDQKGCVTPEQTCNGLNDCQDGSDEANCPVQPCKKPGFFQCADGKCIEEHLVCDGFRQCSSGSDEQNCPVSPCAFTCDKNTKCFPEIVLCDGKEDCADGTDEAKCASIKSLPTAPIPLKCPRTFVMCRDGSDCIPSDQMCDGDKDCSDGSDEVDCSEQCQPGYFQCQKGRKCIEDRLRCDGFPQCPDGSDEVGCRKPTETCAFHCDGNSHCFPETFKCDGERDCLDGTDEANCAHEECGQEEFQCSNGQCISSSLRCDGGADCRDHSDELNCFKLPHCPSERRCPDSKECLLEEWLCDGERDCEDGSDEKACKWPEVTCNQNQWTCASNTQCILKEWRCDGQLDCRDGSDEAGCVRSCGSHHFQCNNGECLNTSLACNGRTNCVDGSDEGGDCKKNCKKQCSQICYKTPAGPKCACNPGFTLAKDGSSCIDINECAVMSPNVCSQTCRNSEGSYTCDCLSGYLLEANGHSCKASGKEPFLLAAVQSDVLLYGLQSAKEDVLVSTARNMIFSLDYDWKAQRVFWLSLGSQSIKWISIDQKQKGTLVKGIKSDCIAVDWVGRNLYWTDGISGQIVAVSMYSTAAVPTNYTVVLDEDLDQPRALVLNPHSGFMYWSEIGADPQIEQAGMDGSSRKVLLSKGLGWPISLALDFITSRLYWSDDKLKSIGSVKLDGTDFKLMQLEESPSPLSLSVFEGFLYWSDTKKRVIQRADKSTGKNRKTLLKRLGQPFGLKIMHEVLQPVLPNPCQKLECSHICLTGPEQKAICRCPPGLILETDKATCTLPRDTAFLFVASSTSITQVYLRSIQSTIGMKIMPEHKVFSVPVVNQISAVDYILKNHTLFVADSEGQFIGQFKLKEPSLAFRGKVLQMDRVMVTAMAVDWITLTLYWSGGFPAFICVTSANGAYTATVLENLNQINSIALHPPTGYMCFSELDVKWNKFKIECSFMDGKNRKLVWSEGSRPRSLVFSESGAVLYWADPGMGVIGSVTLDGLKYNEYRTGRDIIAFAYGDNLLFWTTGNDTVKMWYSDGLQAKHLWFETKMKIVGLQVFSKYSQQGTNACVHNGGCNYFCLPYPGGKTCKCPIGYRSGGEADCVKEIRCAEFSKPCRDGRKCIPNRRFCDGEDDCLDGSDEEGCDSSDQKVKTDQKPKEKPSATPTREQPLQGSPRDFVYSGNPTMAAEELLRNLESKSCDREKCHFNGDCYLVNGKVKCNCLLGYGGEYCGGPVFKPISVPLTLGVAFVLLAFFAAVVIFAVVQKRRKEAQRNKDKQKTAMKDIEGDQFSSQTFANDIYDGEVVWQLFFLFVLVNHP
uniref:Low-density lipoprotein receptor-related protein 2-like n=1 Tax=Erpetoichthys calabaricus TaxID=27687 RepID=A0A8C4S481_ERPCA